MIRRALAITTGLLAVCFPIAAQQAGSGKGSDANLSLGGFDRKMFGPTHTSLLLQKGPVRAWSDGAQVAGDTVFANISMGLTDLFPAVYANPVSSLPARKGMAASDAPPRDSGPDGKDLPEQVFKSPLNGVYCGGEIGFLYGRWSGKGSGDYLDTYIQGSVGNEHFQITAGAEHQQWSGQASRSRSFIAPR